MKRTTKTLLLLAVGGAVIAAIAFLPARPPAPTYYQGRPTAEWVREALDPENWASTTNARHVVSTQLREKAVPFIVRELQATCYPSYYFRLYDLQTHLPSRLRLLRAPKDTEGKIHAAAFTLGEMGEAARPAMATLGRCLRRSDMKFWELQEVMWEILGMGPPAAGMLPSLRKLAADNTHCMSVQAALAIYTIEGTTNAVAQAIRRKLAKPGSFGSFERELWWFREDERLNGVVLPLIFQAVTNSNRPIRERKEIVSYLGDVITTNALRAQTLRALARSTVSPARRPAPQ